MRIGKLLGASRAQLWAAATLISAAVMLEACAEYLGTSFSEIAPPEIAGREVRPGARCALEMINGARSDAAWQASRERRVVLYGWALNAAQPSGSRWLVVRLRGIVGERKPYYAVTWARAPREDVGRVYGAGPGVEIAAFDLTGTLQQVPPGTYDIDVVLGGPEGPESCATERQLAVV